MRAQKPSSSANSAESTERHHLQMHRHYRAAMQRHGELASQSGDGLEWENQRCQPSVAIAQEVPPSLRQKLAEPWS